MAQWPHGRASICSFLSCMTDSATLEIRTSSNSTSTYTHSDILHLTCTPTPRSLSPPLLCFHCTHGISALRAMVVSVSQITTYDQAKTCLAPYVEGFRQHLVAGIVSALTFTTVSMPFDTVKTRVQQVW